MALTEPKLDFILLDSHSPFNLVIGDTSQYPEGFTPVSPTLEVTPPGFGIKSVSFTPKSIQVLNASNIGLICDEECDVELPDGIYTIKYSIAPAYQYYTQKSILRVDALYAQLDTAFLALELSCNPLRTQDRTKLNEIEIYIQGAIAAAANCANKLAMELYAKAKRLLDDFTSLYGKYCMV